MKVIVSGGGTAGHVFPGLALLGSLSAVNAETEVLYVGSRDGLESSIIQEAGYPFVGLDVSGFPRKISISGLAAILKMAKAVFAARSLVKRFKPDVVVGTGAFVSAPVVFAAALSGIPTVIHEQNAVPGAANRLLGRVVSAVALSFENSRSYFPSGRRCELTGNPVRENIVHLDASEARAVLGLEPETPVVLIFGGSRGARRINDAAIGAARGLLDLGVQVIHSTGKGEYARVKEAVDGIVIGNRKYTVLPFIDNMAAAYAGANLVVCRAGATSIAEIAVCGIPSLLVPYPYATGGHQAKNADALVNAGAAKAIVDGECTPERLLAETAALLEDTEALERMGRAAKSFGRPDAADRLASLVRGVAGVNRGEGEIKTESRSLSGERME